MLARTFLICASAILALAMGACGATFSPSYQECKDRYRYYESHGEVGNLNKPVIGRTEFAVFLRCEGAFLDQNNGTLTAVATVFLVAVTTALAWIARQQYVTTRAQLRAYVFVSGKPDIPPEFSDTHGIAIWFAVRNTGQTPAYKVQQWITTDFLADPHKGPFPKPGGDLRFPRGAIGPNSEIALRASYPRSRITDQQIADIHAGKLTICIWGEVTYKDAFERPHYTRFRFFVPVEHGGRVPGIQLSEQGNEAD